MPCTCHFLAATASSFSLDNNFKYTHHAFISHTWTFLPTDLHMPNGPSRAPYSTIWFNCAPWTTGLFLHTPWKISMEPENTPLEKEKHLHITNFAWFHVGFRGIRMLLLHSQNFPNICNDPPELSSAVQQQRCDFRGCYCSSLPAWCTGTRWPEIKESTFLLTNMSPPKITQGMFEAHFHFPRWDMLVPCRVFSLEGTRPSFDFHVIFSRSEGSGQLAVDVWEDSPPWCLR